MTNTFNNLTLVKYLLVLTIILIGCRKSDRDQDLETLSARDNALAYHIFDDAWREVHRIAMQDTLLGYYDSNLIRRPNECILFTDLSDTLPVFPLYLTINYGDEGETCNDGFKRYGVISASFSSRYITPGSEVIIGFNGYRKDLFDVEGLIRVNHIGFQNDQPQYLITVEDGRITGNNIDIEWEGVHTYTWIQGSSTYSAIFDDVFTIEGIATGINSRGVSFVNEISTSPSSFYRSDLSCQWFKVGRSELEVDNLTTRYINYDDTAACNNILLSRRNNTFLEVRIPYDKLTE